jgi:CHASE2 domain-containing sensor protein
MPRLAQAHPAMIVSDIGFSSDRCRNSAETSSLVNSIREASRATPVVIGEGARSIEEITETQGEELKKRGFRENDLLLTPSLPFDSQGNIHFGLMRFNADFRRVPIRWSTHENASSPVTLKDSLSFAAAKEYRSTFPDQGLRLRRLEFLDQHPFISFLNENDFPSTSPIKLICNADHVSSKNWKSCGPTEGDSQERDKLRGHVLVLGFDDNGTDLWSTDIGKLPGFVLHANYLEALLDERVYRSVPFVVESTVVIAVTLLIHTLLVFPGIPARSALLISGALWGLTLLILDYLLLVNFYFLFSLAGLGSAWLVAVGLKLHTILEENVHNN